MNKDKLFEIQDVICSFPELERHELYEYLDYTKEEIDLALHELNQPLSGLLDSKK